MNWFNNPEQTALDFWEWSLGEGEELAVSDWIAKRGSIQAMPGQARGYHGYDRADSPHHGLAKPCKGWEWNAVANLGPPMGEGAPRNPRPEGPPLGGLDDGFSQRRLEKLRRAQLEQDRRKDAAERRAEKTRLRWEQERGIAGRPRNEPKPEPKPKNNDDWPVALQPGPQWTRATPRQHRPAFRYCVYCGKRATKNILKQTYCAAHYRQAKEYRASPAFLRPSLAKRWNELRDRTVE